MTAVNRWSLPKPWINWGAIALILGTLAYLFFWPGPEGLPVVKAGIPAQTINIEATVTGIKDLDAQTRFQKGSKVTVIIDNAPPQPMSVQTTSLLPNTIVGTQPDGTVKAQPDPRPEMQFSKNLLITLEGSGYANNKGTFLGTKRTRIGSAIRILAPNFETQASVVNVKVKE